MYEWTKALHILSVVAFFMAHGASATVSLRLQAERDPGRIRALLELSAAAMGPVTWIFALAMIVTGVVLGFLGAWWGEWWIWGALVLFVVVAGVMTPLGAFRMNALRAALGMRIGKRPTPPALTGPELDSALSRYDPRPATWVGGLGLAVIVLLMVLKPH